jgi:carbon-monoxide dehydrogenase iron sulfur subunit
MKTVFVNPERCIGCKQCEAACAVAHSKTHNVFLAALEQPTPKPRIHAEPGLSFNTSFPNKCRHCSPAPCLSACPTGAIYRAANHDEIVLIDSRKCIACGMCAMVCPFDVITYYASADAPYRQTVATKCDNCIERQRAGQVPACVEACKVGALQFGEINELAKAARTHYSEVVSAAVGQLPDEMKTTPLSVEIWRGWGLAVTRMNADGEKGAER